MKMIISCRRNTSLSREAFFDHLRNTHWPLIQRYPAILAALGGYIQNHTLGEASSRVAKAPFRLATERDSVIELFFVGPEELGKLVATPDYLAHIRPDEARFNDLSSNIMVKTAPESIFDPGQTGRCKRFDFIVRGPAVSAERFAKTLAADARRLALDPVYTARVDRQVHNNPLREQGPGAGFGQGGFDCVREVWASRFEALGAVAVLSHVPDADQEKSFSIFATEFIMKAPAI